MPDHKSMLSHLEKVIRRNVVMYFARKPDTEKTLAKVEEFALKQLDFFISEMMKSDAVLKRSWSNGHPFTAKAAINKETMDFEIKIVEKEPGKW